MEQLLLSCFCFHVREMEGREGGRAGRGHFPLSLLFSVLVLPWFLAYGCFKTVLSGTSMIVFLSVSS